MKNQSFGRLRIDPESFDSERLRTVELQSRTGQKSKIVIIAVAGILMVTSLLLQVGCQLRASRPQKRAAKKETKKAQDAKGSAHIISPQTAEEILRDAQDDINIITKVSIETEELEKAMTGPALEDMSRTIENDLKAGRMKIREYDQVKVNLKNFTQGVAGVTLEFVDRSYYVDKETIHPLTSPENVPRRYTLSLIKSQGKWKINGIYSQSKDEPSRK